MTKTQLKAALVAAFGENWKLPASRALNVSVKTIKNWVSGYYAIPPNLHIEVLEILSNRIDEINAVIGDIERPTHRGPIPNTGYEWEIDWSNIDPKIGKVKFMRYWNEEENKWETEEEHKERMERGKDLAELEKTFGG